MTCDRDPALDVLQRWMQAVIMHPGGVAAGAASDAARSEIPHAAHDIDRVIVCSQAQSALERLEIYNRSYFARLLECLRAEYSVLARALGDDLFDAFALGYLQQHPSTSYTLADLGRRFPDYLAATRPAGDRANQASINQSAESESSLRAPAPFDWPAFMIDLARLEQAINEVFDGPGAEHLKLLDHERLAQVPPECWPQARLVCVPCLKLVRTSFAVNEYFTAMRRHEDASLPPREESYIALNRRDYRVARYPLGAAQYGLLSSLLAGETVADAIACAGRATSIPDDQLAAELERWFSTWVADGFFQDVTLE